MPTKMNPEYKVGDIVEMNYGIPNCRIVGIPYPDRVDVVYADSNQTNRGIGVPVGWVKGVISSGKVKGA